jgi:two-component system chemotaxis response regulator CheY
MVQVRHGAPLAGLEVLVVDDNKFMLSLMKTVLRQGGVGQLHQANDGADALEKLQTINPDLVILDWIMPMLSGAEFMKALRQPSLGPLANTRVLVFTGFATREMVLEAARLQVNGVVAKPIVPEILYKRIREVLASPAIGPYVAEQGASKTSKDEPVARAAGHDAKAEPTADDGDFLFL